MLLLGPILTDTFVDVLRFRQQLVELMGDESLFFQVKVAVYR